eukprot:436020_1
MMMTKLLMTKKLRIVCNVINNKKHKVSSIYNTSNSSKYVTYADYQAINFQEISSILKSNNMLIEVDDFQNACEGYGYYKQHLINDLCDIRLNGENQNITLVEIISNELNFNQQTTRQRLYDIILHQYVTKQDLDNNNFIKILRKRVSELFELIDCDEVADIARNTNLTGDIFNKASSAFKNSIKFAQVFKSINGWNKKQWQKIYQKINRWQITISEKTHASQKTEADTGKEKTKTILLSQSDTHYIDKSTDTHLVEEFCTITKSTKEIAVTFLKMTEWNVLIAVNKYYANGKISNTDYKNEYHSDDEFYSNQSLHEYHSDDDIHDNKNQLIYNHGISFWYWEKQRSNKIYIKKRFTNLKEEILRFRKFTSDQWNCLVVECNNLRKTDRVKSISSNGHDEDIYEIQKHCSITLDHMCSIKLYTDYSWLCKIFCETFRLKKISKNQYERIQSAQFRNRKIANWARLLIESVQCFSKLRTAGKRYYRGVGNEFIFKRFVARFNVPLSTTIDFNKAVQFTEGNGLVMELKVYNSFLFGLNC